MNNTPKPIIHLLELTGTPILDQLRIEEALLRADSRNWCIINHGAPPAIVMGISGIPDKLINYPLLCQNPVPVPVIRRFSGGGTVFIDPNTVFVTFICNEQHLNVRCYPQHVFQWSGRFYQPVFEGLDFQLKENDYILGNKKFGGNAQYMRKDRWLHHSSLLWDYDADAMQCLLIPEKAPAYRENRSHSDFLSKLKDFIPSKKILHDKVLRVLHQQFDVEDILLHNIKEITTVPHRQATARIK